ncbi:MAG: hypothetical protein M1319_04795 [Chloroflexi bacterium]|nr:hypothetical protein [Chloroflexota bacterium]
MKFLKFSLVALLLCGLLVQPVLAASPTDSAGTLGVDLQVKHYAKLTVLTPEANEILESGSLYTITWGAPSDSVAFDLQYSLDGGLTYHEIDSKVPGASYQWTVPATNGNITTCKIRIMGYNAAGTKVSLGKSKLPFTIQVLKVVAPNGGETLVSGSLTPITWQVNATKKPVAKVVVSYTKNGGTTWKKIAAFTGSSWTSTETTHTLKWTVPTVYMVKNACKVKVVLKDAAGLVIASDVSDAPFTIQPKP